MCSPVEIAMAAFQAVSSHNAAVDAANTQNARYIQNVQNSRVAFEDDNRAANRRIAQERDAEAQAKFDKSIEALEATGRVQTAAGEASVAGNSVRALFNDVERRKAMAQGTIARNTDMRVAQVEDQKQASVNTFMNRVNSVQKAEAPSMGDFLQDLAINVGTSYVSNHVVPNAGANTNNPTIKWLTKPIFN